MAGRVSRVFRQSSQGRWIATDEDSKDIVRRAVQGQENFEFQDVFVEETK